MSKMIQAKAELRYTAEVLQWVLSLKAQKENVVGKLS